jgi:PHD/YefM family antitoxin component YafN of YafNO toxin-antitoxin module
MTTLTAREFNQDAGGAKRAAQAGPVFITDRGRPSHVLLTFGDFQRLAGHLGSLADLLAQPANVELVDVEIHRFDDIAQPAAFD